MHHPALAVHAAQNAHRQAGIPHRPHPAAVHQKPRSRPGFEQPRCAGVEIHAYQIQRSAALVLAFQCQRHIHQPCGQLCRKARLQQACRQLCSQIPVHRRRPAGAHAVAQDHLRRRRAAELLHCVAGNAAPCRRACHAEHCPQCRLFAEQQRSQPLAGEHLRRFQRGTADAPHLTGQRCQLLRRKPGAGQRDRCMHPPQIIQRDRALLRRRAQRGKKICYAPGFIGFRVARAAELFAQNAQRLRHSAVLLGQGGAHGLGMDARLLAAAIQRKRPVCRRAQRRRVDAAR